MNALPSGSNAGIIPIPGDGVRWPTRRPGSQAAADAVNSTPGRRKQHNGRMQANKEDAGNSVSRGDLLSAVQRQRVEPLRIVTPAMSGYRRLHDHQGLAATKKSIAALQMLISPVPLTARIQTR